MKFQRLLIGALGALLALGLQAQTISPPGGTINGVTAGCGLGGGGVLGNVSVAENHAVNPQIGTSYTFVAGDCGKLTTFANVASIAATLPAAGGTGFGSGITLYVSNIGPGVLTITPVSGNISGLPNLALAAFNGAILVSDGANWQNTAFVNTAGFANLTAANTWTALNNFTGGILINGVTPLTAAATVTLIGDVSGTGAGSITTSISPNAVTYSKIQNVSPSRLLGNYTGTTGLVTEVGLGATLAFSTATAQLQTNALTGDVTSSANSYVTQLQQIRGTAVSGTTGGGGSVVLSQSPTLANFTASTINNVAITKPSIQATLTLSPSTIIVGPVSSSTLAALTLADQTLSGGANVTSLSQATGSIIIDCGARPLQFITNGGSFTITAPTNDGSCITLITNNASAGTITFSGFTVGTTGDALTTTNGNKFMATIVRINAIATYVVKALQ